MYPNWPHQYSTSNNNTDQTPPYNHSIQTTSSANYSLQQQLRRFWEAQRQESLETVDFRAHSLPLARIKKIMKSDEDVRMISAEAPVFLARACEMFILDLTLRSWSSTEDGKRRTLQKADIAAALSTTDLFDFLVDIVPREKAIMPPPMMSEGRDCGVGEGAGLAMGLQLPLPSDDGGVIHQGYSGHDGNYDYFVRHQGEDVWSCLAHEHEHATGCGANAMQRPTGEF